MAERKRRGRFALLALAAVTVLAAPALAAKRPAPEQQKIDHLIQDVKESKAIFIRNGVEYPGEKAVSHLKFKLMMAGSRVQTARDFIEGVASRSSESGKPYLIRLPGSTTSQPIRDWLLARLAAYEKAPASPPARP